MVIPGLYRHVKGGLYRVVGVALQEHDPRGERLVIYRPAEGSWPSDVPPADFWARPEGEFEGRFSWVGSR